MIGYGKSWKRPGSHLIGCLAVAACSLARPAVAFEPLHNLGWFLRDVVVVARVSEESYLEWRMKSPVEAEFLLRDQATSDTLWIKNISHSNKVAETNCDDFSVSNFADWAKANSASVSIVPQWREVWHGVSTRASFQRVSLGSSELKRIELAAAVLGSGMPVRAFSESSEGALRQRFFDVASRFKGGGFDRMARKVQHLKMRLLKRQSCNGFELYVWQFDRK